MFMVIVESFSGGRHAHFQGGGAHSRGGLSAQSGRLSRGANISPGGAPPPPPPRLLATGLVGLYVSGAATLQHVFSLRQRNVMTNLPDWL